MFFLIYFVYLFIYYQKEEHNVSLTICGLLIFSPLNFAFLKLLFNGPGYKYNLIPKMMVPVNI